MFCLIFIVSFSFANRTVVEILGVLLQQLVVLLQLGWKTEKKTGNWELKGVFRVVVDECRTVWWGLKGVFRGVVDCRGV